MVPSWKSHFPPRFGHQLQPQSQQQLMVPLIAQQIRGNSLFWSSPGKKGSSLTTIVFENLWHLANKNWSFNLGHLVFRERGENRYLQYDLSTAGITSNLLGSWIAIPVIRRDQLLHKDSRKRPRPAAPTGTASDEPQPVPKLNLFLKRFEVGNALVNLFGDAWRPIGCQDLESGSGYHCCDDALFCCSDLAFEHQLLQSSSSDPHSDNHSW